MWRILYILSWIWQCPQNIIGWLIVRKKQPRRLLPGGVKLYCIEDMIIPSLVMGEYIIVNKEMYKTTSFVRHLFGHFLQSFRLGPLYLFIIFIPSVFWVFLCPKENYYMEFYTEKWANKLSAKKRK